MKSSKNRTLTALTLIIVSMQAAQAHVSFLTTTAGMPTAGKTYLATLNIPHGCEDANAAHFDTTKVEVTVPSGFTSVRPMDTTFGASTVEKDEAGNVTKLIWTKSTAALTNDDHYYQIVFRGTLPNTPFTTLGFVTTQTCAGDTTKTWEGADAPKLLIFPARALGWNKYTAQTDFDEAAIKKYFADAYIVWSGSAAYSANSVTAGLISTPLTAITTGSDFWVKY